MSAVRVFVGAFCTGCILLGALYILVPKGNFSKPVKFAICLCFLLSLITVAVNVNPGSGDIPGFIVNNTDFDNEALAAESARMVFAEALRSAGINFSKITVFTDKSVTGGINIIKVYVYTLSSPEDVKAVIGSDDYGVVVING